MTHAETFGQGIQGFMAVAVVAVLLFHLWPMIVRGGYIGVDVFFVISGYLITGFLLIRRQLPAATAATIAVTGCLQFERSQRSMRP